jgi:hypothetical protein
VKIHAKGMEGERLRVTEGQEERTQERWSFFEWKSSKYFRGYRETLQFAVKSLSSDWKSARISATAATESLLNRLPR